jgi:hypothetical protein
MTSTAPGHGAPIVDRVIRSTVVPIADLIPVLVRSGALLVGFAIVWAAFFAALLLDPAALDSARTTLDRLPLLVQILAWVSFLPPMAGLWIWGTDWSMAIRIVLIVGLAGWNLLVFIPRPDATGTLIDQE